MVVIRSVWIRKINRTVSCTMRNWLTPGPNIVLWTAVTLSDGIYYHNASVQCGFHCGMCCIPLTAFQLYL